MQSCRHSECLHIIMLRVIEIHVPHLRGMLIIFYGLLSTPNRRDRVRHQNVFYFFDYVSTSCHLSGIIPQNFHLSLASVNCGIIGRLKSDIEIINFLSGCVCCAGEDKQMPPSHSPGSCILASLRAG